MQLYWRANQNACLILLPLVIRALICKDTKALNTPDQMCYSK